MDGFRLHTEARVALAEQPCDTVGTASVGRGKRAPSRYVHHPFSVGDDARGAIRPLRDGSPYRYRGCWPSKNGGLEGIITI
jgi:hypothetical protein